MKKFLSMSFAAVMLASTLLSACSSGTQTQETSTTAVGASSEESKEASKEADNAEGTVLKFLVPGYQLLKRRTRGLRFKSYL